ncbi:MAG: alpha/beta fold hydrolase [Thermoplasmata archaeon]
MERSEFQTSLGRISFLERKGKYPAIFLHGLGGTGNSWIKLQRYLSEDLALYFLDLLGHGRSSKPETEYTISLQEAALREFILGMGFERFSLIGNSYGGWISLRFAVDILEPEKIVLEDSAGINRTFGELDVGEREVLIRRIMASNRMNEERVIRSIVVNNADPKWKLKVEELQSLKSRTLILWGGRDSVIPRENGLRFKELIPNSTYVEISDGGHVPHVTHPEHVGRILNDFLLS